MLRIKLTQAHTNTHTLLALVKWLKCNRIETKRKISSTSPSNAYYTKSARTYTHTHKRMAATIKLNFMRAKKRQTNSYIWKKRQNFLTLLNLFLFSFVSRSGNRIFQYVLSSAQLSAVLPYLESLCVLLVFFFGNAFIVINGCLMLTIKNAENSKQFRQTFRYWWIYQGEQLTMNSKHIQAYGSRFMQFHVVVFFFSSSSFCLRAGIFVRFVFIFLIEFKLMYDSPHE